MAGAVSVVKVLNENADGAANGYILTMKDDADNDGYKVFTVVDNAYDSADPETAGYVNAADVTSFSKNSAKIGAIVVNNKTVFVLHTGDNKFKVVTGLNNMDSYATLASQLVPSVVKNGVAQVVYMDVASATATTAVDNLVYVLSATPVKSYDAVNKCDVYTYATTDGTIATKDATVSVGLNKITKMSDGYVADNGMALVSGGKYTVQSVSAKEVTFEEGVLTIDTTAYVVAADVDVTMIDANDNVTFEADVDELAGDVVTGTYYIIAKAVDNATVVAVYFDGTID
jgi:hypothetical protein